MAQESYSLKTSKYHASLMLTRTPKITFVTACYNSERTIKKTFRSGLSLSGLIDYEHIFVDGASTDSTLVLLRQFAEVSPMCRYVSESDLGIFDAMNKGANIAKGKFLFFLNSDDWLVKADAARFLMSITTEHDIAYADISLFDQEECLRLKPTHPRCRASFYNLPFHHPSSVVSKQVFDALGGFSLDYAYSSDFDFFVRAFASRCRFSYINVCPTVMTGGGAGTQNSDKAIFEQILSLRANGFYSAIPLAVSRLCYSFLRGRLLQLPLGRQFYASWRKLRASIAWFI